MSNPETIPKNGVTSGTRKTLFPNHEYALISIDNCVNAQSFESFFNDLPIDPYSIDTVNRCQRYSRFKIVPGGYCQLGKKAFVEKTSQGPSFSDTSCYFMKLDERLLQLADFHALLDTFASKAMVLLCSEEKDQRLNIELGVHQIRIVAQKDDKCESSPISIDHNECDLVGIVCIKRQNITGGLIQLYHDQNSSEIVEMALEQNQLVLYDNRSMSHCMTPLMTIDDKDGEQDVFVITAASSPLTHYQSQCCSNNISSSAVATSIFSSANIDHLVIILIPDLDNPAFRDIWQSTFDKYLNAFSTMADVSLFPVPWPKAPVTFSTPPKVTYIASLVWGYHLVENRWLQWLKKWPKEKCLLNSVNLLEWNTRKTYLNKLEEAKVPVVPTLFVDDGLITHQILKDAAVQFGDVNELVVKPQVSASADCTMRISVNNPSSPTIETKSPMMIQPFIENICKEGEYSICVFGSKVSHAIVKHPAENDFRVQSEFGGTRTTFNEPTDEMLNIVSATLAACLEQPIYARIDMVRDSAGNLRILELELIEPYLSLEHASDNGLAFAHAVLNAKR